MKNKKSKKGKQTDISSFFSQKKKESIIEIIDNDKCKDKKLKIDKTKKDKVSEIEKEYIMIL